MTKKATDTLTECAPSPLEQAYLILARQTRMLPTVHHLEALDAMHRARYEQMLDEVDDLYDLCRELRDGLDRLATRIVAPERPRPS